MTLYAYQDGILAIDRMCVQQGIRITNAHKFHILNDRSVVCGSGSLDTIRHVAHRLAHDQVDPWDMAKLCFENDEDTFVHRFYQDGRVVAYCSEGFHPDESGLWVVGGYHSFLSGCMAAGLNAVDAVITGCHHIRGSDFPIDVIDVRSTAPAKVIHRNDPQATRLQKQFPIQPLLPTETF